LVSFLEAWKVVGKMEDLLLQWSRARQFQAAPTPFDSASLRKAEPNMPDQRRHPSRTRPKFSILDTCDDLSFFMAEFDNLVATFRDLASQGAHLTVEQIVEDLMPDEGMDHKTLMDHCFALAFPFAILLQRAVMG
jgi:hypothetical protein